MICGAGALPLTSGSVFSFGGGGGGTTEPNFILDFLPDTNSDGSFGWGGGGFGGDGNVGNQNDQTFFLQENLGGYVHQLIGTPDDDFAQDVYIQSGECCNTSMNSPFGSGTGDANPTRVIMRQRVRDVESLYEFLKDKLNAKPVITSIVNDGGLVSTFIADMSAISYQDSTTPSDITITTEFIGQPPDTAFIAENFDFATDVQKSEIHGGRFSYSLGNYSYADGDGFNLNGINWAAFCDPEQNLNSSDGFGG